MSETCQLCGQHEATCFGESDGHAAFACDECCGHGNEDGWCVYLDEGIAAMAGYFTRLRAELSQVQGEAERVVQLERCLRAKEQENDHLPDARQLAERIAADLYEDVIVRISQERLAARILPHLERACPRCGAAPTRMRKTSDDDWSEKYRCGTALFVDEDGNRRWDQSIDCMFREKALALTPQETPDA